MHNRPLFHSAKLRRVLLQKQRHLLRSRRIILPKNLHRFPPRSLLNAVEFAEVEDVPLDVEGICTTPVFDDTPRVMNSAILATL